MKIIILAFFLTFGIIKTKQPQEEIDYVPDKETAVKIAEAIWLPIFGKRILKNKPFIVELKNDVWVVEGTLPLGMKGGTPYIEIQKKDSKILNVSHGK